MSDQDMAELDRAICSLGSALYSLKRAQEALSTAGDLDGSLAGTAEEVVDDCEWLLRDCRKARYGTGGAR
ncbi:MAG TPA: hypothetical protein VGN26_04035 [Armatimonadota bacterium]|jgi:hypothetical protein